MPRALIIGHSGQDGQFLWAQLRDREFELLGTSSTSLRRNDGTSDSAPIDILDSAQVDDLVQGFAPDQIYFLAAFHHSSQERAADARSLWRASWDVHVRGFLNVLHAVKEYRRQARVFYASSSRIFGQPSASPQDESTALNPECVYGITKASAMMMAKHFRASYDVHVSCGILFNHESPLRDSKFVSQRIVKGLVAIRHGAAHAPLVLGDLDAQVDWGYAGDYTRAMQLILAEDTPQDYVIASGRTHTVRELVEVAAACLSLSPADSATQGAQVLNRRSQGLCGNPSLLQRTTGWRMRVSFEEMIAEMVGAATVLYQREQPQY